MVSPARHHKATPAPPERAIGAVVARFVHTEEVTGSNPVSPTKPIGDSCLQIAQTWSPSSFCAASLRSPPAGAPPPAPPVRLRFARLLWLLAAVPFPASVTHRSSVGLRFARLPRLLAANCCPAGVTRRGWQAFVSLGSGGCPRPIAVQRGLPTAVRVGLRVARRLPTAIPPSRPCCPLRPAFASLGGGGCRRDSLPGLGCPRDPRPGRAACRRWPTGAGCSSPQAVQGSPARWLPTQVGGCPLRISMGKVPSRWATSRFRRVTSRDGLPDTGLASGLGCGTWAWCPARVGTVDRLPGGGWSPRLARRLGESSCPTDRLEVARRRRGLLIAVG
jgi:hypothetical protein